MQVSRANLRKAALIALVGTAAMAQDPWTYTLKFGGGPASGGLLSPLGRAGYSLGADFEVAFRRSPEARLALSLGWRAFPGDYINISSIPFTYAATNVNPTIYETRVRKPEGSGFQLTGFYRGTLSRWEGVYWQAGLRLGANKLKETDTGTQLVTDGRASTVSGNILAVNAIAETREKTTLSLGPVAGVGYEFREFVLELNLWMATVESPALGKKSGLASELAFGFRF
ncbi:MAG: hypothetical protein HY823_03540 [Acidobacteria bacterium]|nr:hypothetical protein [Acidobacteriota bacterium]